MEGNWTSTHERNINGYSTHVRALFPEHVHAMYMQECTSPKEDLNEHYRKFTGYDGIYVNYYKLILVAAWLRYSTRILSRKQKKKWHRVVLNIKEGRDTEGDIVSTVGIRSRMWSGRVRRNTEEWEDRIRAGWRPYRGKECLKLQPVTVMPNQRPTVRLQPSSTTTMVNENFGEIHKKFDSILKCHYCERTHALR